MAERLIDTGRIAPDGKRHIFVDRRTGALGDRDPDCPLTTYKLVGRASSLRSRVLIQGDDGVLADVTPERARQVMGIPTKKRS